MPNPGDLVPYGEDALVRRQDDTNRKLREGLAARSLAASQIGDGGLLQIDGDLQVNGAITLPGTLSAAGGLTATTGDISAPAGNVSAGGSVSASGSVAAGTNVTAGGDVSATGAVTAGGNISTPATISGGALTATGDVTAGGSGIFPVGLSSAGAYNNLLTSGYRVAYVSSAAFGYVPSSRQFKQDIVTAGLPEDIWLALRLVTFRYIAAVTEFGDDASIEIGLIAEEVHELGLHWLVDYDEDGEPFGVKYDKLALLLVPALQSIDARLRAAGL